VDCFDEGMTVAAMVAADACGSRQYGYGTLRDYVIGIEAIDGQGRVFHAGGRVVKNVAGYDLCRLMIGSRGALGLITQVTFKVKPLPECTNMAVYHFETADAFEDALKRLNVTPATPVVMDFSAQHHRPGWIIQLGVEGTPETCDWQLQQLDADCRASGTRIDVVPDCADHCRRVSSCGSSAAATLHVLPSCVTVTTQSLLKHAETVTGHAGTGILHVPCDKHAQTPSDNADDHLHHASPERIAEWRRLAEVGGGSVVVWPEDHPGHQTDILTQRLRRTFDPHSVFLW
jgi:glycolate oxidase FAD binding subunit